jgi:hypothetical protein
MCFIKLSSPLTQTICLCMRGGGILNLWAGPEALRENYPTVWASGPNSDLEKRFLCSNITCTMIMMPLFKQLRILTLEKKRVLLSKSSHQCDLLITEHWRLSRSPDSVTCRCYISEKKPCRNISFCGYCHTCRYLKCYPGIYNSCILGTSLTHTLTVHHD